MIETITNILVQFGYVGIFLCMFIETIFPPIPSEVVLPFAGYAVYQGKLNMIGVIASGTVGSLAGAGVFYYLGRVLKEARLASLLPNTKMGRFQRA
jgi:membrane protein DedA with SNARE-associated domain